MNIFSFQEGYFEEVYDSFTHIFDLNSLDKQITANSPHADGGPHSPICSCRMVSLVPHQLEWKFLGSPVCKVTSKHLPKHLRRDTHNFMGEIIFFW